MSAARIAALNDAFRRSGAGGRTMLSAGIAAMPREAIAGILAACRAFESFDRGNDPHGERDFGAFEAAGKSIFWKIDYYDKALEFGSEDPADPERTARVLTIMLASEY